MTMYKDLTPEQKKAQLEYNIKRYALKKDEILAKNRSSYANKYKNNPEFKAKRSAYSKQYRPTRTQEWKEEYIMEKAKTPWKFMVDRAKQRARKKGIECTITYAYVESIWTDTCPILDIPLYCGKGEIIDNSPSLDRIDPNKGYVPGNVQVISNRANMIKNCGTLEEHRKILNYLTLLEAVQKDSAAA